MQILQDGCAHMRKAFDIEDINLDDLIATAMEDPQAVAGDAKVLQGINFSDLHTSATGNSARARRSKPRPSISAR